MPGYPNRCQHIKVNGVQCGSPALRRNRFCFFHKRYHDQRIRLAADRARRAPGTFTLPVLEDANSIQIALMEVMSLLLSRQIEHKTASLLLYALQTASTNLRRTQFSPNQHDIILDPRDAAITPLDYRAWEDDEFPDDEEEDEDEEENQEDDEGEGDEEDDEQQQISKKENKKKRDTNHKTKQMPRRKNKPPRISDINRLCVFLI